MENSLSLWISILNLLIAFQGFVLALNFFVRPNSTTILTFHVGLLLMACSLFLVNAFFILQEELHYEFITQPLSNMFLLSVGPSLYIYLKSTYHKHIVSKSVLSHHLVFLVVLILFFVLKREVWDLLGLVIGFLQLGIYLVLCLKLVSNTPFSIWIRPMLYTFTAVYVLNLILKGFQLVIDVPLLVTINSTLLFGIPIFWIAFKELNKTKNIFRIRRDLGVLDEKKEKAYVLKIETAMQRDNLYRHQDLTVKKMSEYIQVPINTISQIINLRFGKSFPDYVNEYRVEEVKKNLLASDFKAFTVLGIAEQSGFTSGSRFNLVFKKATGMTPTEYRKKHNSQGE
nr:AraC family transcriptional regulator [uncultured Allomuricauda sp.]